MRSLREVTRMKIWFDSENTAFGGKKYFAVVEEFLVDKDGNPILSPSVSSSEKRADTFVTSENAELIAKVDQIIENVSEYEKVVKTETNENIETVNRTETNENIETVNRTESVENVETVNRIETNENVETVNKTETNENIVASEQTAEEEIAEVAVVRSEALTEEEQPETLVADAFEPEQEAQDSLSVADASDLGDVDVSSVTVVAAIAGDNGQEAREKDSNVNVAVVAGAVGEQKAEVSGEQKAPIRSRNFAEKMRDADEVMQDRYDELKNYALRFRKLKARISKKFDSINAGRFQFVKLSIAGKTLKLYLNMDITTTDPKYHCKDMSDKKTYVTVPVLLRIKSGRAVKYAKRLIDQCAEQHGMLERRKPLVVDSMALIEEALKAREEKNAELDDEVLDDVAATDAGADE